MDDRIDFLRKKSAHKWRIHVLRLIITRYYLAKRPELVDKAEEILDSQLWKYQFDVEKIINLWGKAAVSLDWPVDCSDCGYRPPFCGCKR